MVLQQIREDYYEAWLTLLTSARTVTKVSERNLVKFGISIGEFMVLRTLAESGPCPMVDLAKEQFISQPALTSIVDNLQEHELVERIRDKDDRRVINIEITNKGEKLFAQAEAVYKQFFEDIMSTLTRQEISIILSGFDKLSKSAQMYKMEKSDSNKTPKKNIRKN